MEKKEQQENKERRKTGARPCQLCWADLHTQRSGRSHSYVGLLSICALQNSILAVDPVGVLYPLSRERRQLLLGLSPLVLIRKKENLWKEQTWRWSSVVEYLPTMCKVLDLAMILKIHSTKTNRLQINILIQQGQKWTGEILASHWYDEAFTSRKYRGVLGASNNNAWSNIC